MKDITINKCLLLLLDVAAFFEASVLKEVRMLCVISTITVRCKVPKKADYASGFSLLILLL